MRAVPLLVLLALVALAPPASAADVEGDGATSCPWYNPICDIGRGVARLYSQFLSPSRGDPTPLDGLKEETIERLQPVYDGVVDGAQNVGEDVADAATCVTTRFNECVLQVVADAFFLPFQLVGDAIYSVAEAIGRAARAVWGAIGDAFRWVGESARRSTFLLFEAQGKASEDAGKWFAEQFPALGILAPLVGGLVFIGYITALVVVLGLSVGLLAQGLKIAFLKG